MIHREMKNSQISVYDVISIMRPETIIRPMQIEAKGSDIDISQSFEDNKERIIPSHIFAKEKIVRSTYNSYQA